MEKDLGKKYQENVKLSIKKNIKKAKEVYEDTIKPNLETQGEILKEKAKETRKKIETDIAPEVKKSLHHSREAMKGVNIMDGLKDNFWSELFTNGIAWMLAIGVAKTISFFFVVNDLHNLFGLSGDKSRIALSKDNMEIMLYSIEFIVGIIVFTFVEKFIENLIAIYKEDKTEENNR